MMFNLTDLAKKSVDVATTISLDYGGDVGTEHLLYGLLSVDCNAQKLLKKFGVTAENFAKVLEQTSNKMHTTNYDFTPRSKGAFTIANSIAKKVGQTYISTEHLLIAILSQDDCYAVRYLASVYRINVYDLRNRAIALVTGVKPEKKNQEFDTSGFTQLGNVKNRVNPMEQQSQEATSDLNEELLSMGNDVTLRAKNGKIDPIIGRDAEIERVIEILCRKTKNNPVLIGEAGVGKSAIVEGLALKIVKGDVPELLKGKTIYSLDIGGLMAGTKYRGSMEEKLKNAIDTIVNNKNIIVFIDEIHTLAQAGSEKGETSPADMLKPYLARGEMQTIGATTTDEYRKFIEQDKALERRFQPIMVAPPSVEDTIKILKGLRDSYEAFHKVKISDGAIEAAAKLSDKYIMDRSLPDKAIDLVDEAMSRAKVKNNYTPKQEVEVEKKLAMLEANKEDAVMQEDFEKASKLRDEINAYKKQIDEIKKLPSIETKNEITEDDIAEVVSKWTGIPVTKMTQGETEKLLKLEEVLSSRVKGQDEAIQVVAKAIRRSRIGIADPKRPIGSFLFLGSTGVGKTELCKALAEALFDSENKMIRLDMSEFMEPHSVSKLIGSPPGYVGFDDGGQLTEQVRRKPYSVVLFDEIEKAHPDVFNVLLQILEDGRLTDSHGRVVSFKNTIIILTSNIGSEKLSSNRIDLGFYDKPNAEKIENNKQVVLDELKKHFRPELINRIDNIVVFNKLSDKVLTEIAKNMLVQLNKNLKEKNIELKFTASTLKYLVANGTNADYGARPLRRLITTAIEDELADMYLRGDVKDGNTIMVDCKDNKLQFLVK